MTDKQPEALRLADVAQRFGLGEDVAVELRRLHEVVDGFVLAAKKAEQAINILWVSHHANRADHALELLRLALTKAEEK